MLAHLMCSGKSVATERESTEVDGVALVKKPVDRAREFVFGGYIYDVSVCRVASVVFVKSKSFASQRKHVVYKQKLILQDDEVDVGDSVPRSTSVVSASCIGCAAGGEGGLCSHVLARLMVLEMHGFGTYTQDRTVSVTSKPQSWGPRKRNVDPHPIIDVIVEKSKLE